MAAASLRFALALVLTAFLSGCGGEDGNNGVNGVNGSDGRDATPVLINASAEPAGLNCPAGGSRIDSGQDVNLNGTLEPAEVQVASYICHGSDGSDGLLALASTESVGPGEECPAGGYRVDTGIDLNGNGVLETAEIQHTSYACNGLDGVDGEDGQDGQDGQDGEDGLSALIKTEVELPGAVCPAGGIRVLSGMDANRNGLLDTGEEAQTSYLCHGEAGSDGQDGTQALLASTQIPAGEQCVAGGYRIDTGLDGNANGLLEDTEVTASFYVCNGVDGENGADGLQSLINISTEPAGDTCAAGGKQIQVGVDLNGNAILESGEIQQSAFLCNGEDGLDGADGQDGAEGQPGDDGLDGADGSDGADGAPGSDGANALLSTQDEPAGENCAAGGVALLVGLDQNGNNVLDSAEVQSTTYLCHGAGGPQVQSFILQYRAQVGGEIVGSTVQEVLLGDAGETVTAVPDSGYYFTTWSDGNASVSRTDSSVQSDLNVLAGFDIYQYTLTYTADNHGSLSGIVGQTVFHGSDGSAVQAMPETGYHFVSWSDGSVQNPRVDLAAQQNVSVSASFEINEYSLTYLAGAGGSVTGNSTQIVAHGGDGAVVAAVPDSGYRFIQWSDGVTTTNRTDANVQGDLQVTAEFREQLSPPEEVSTGVNNGSLVLSWDSNPYADSYNVYYALEPGVTPDNYASLPGGGMLTGVSSPVTLDELEGGQRYYFVITTVIDGSESASGDEISLLLPNTPWLVSAHQGRLRVDLTSATTANVDWDIELDETGSSFNLYISKDPEADLSQYASYGVELRLNVTPPVSIENLQINEPVYIALEVDGRITDWTNTVSTTWGVNGTVNTLALGDDGTRYVGGSFTMAGQNVGGVAAFPAGNSAVNPHILALPQVNGAVHAVMSDGQGGWYIGGDFTRAGDYARMRLAHIAPSGRVTDWNPGANDSVRALARHGNTIYAGGDFTSAGNGTAGIARNKLAAFDANGELLSWNPYANGSVKALAVSDDAVFVGGDFTQIGGGSAAVNRAYAAKIDFGGALLSWASVPGRVNALVISNDQVFVGGRFVIGSEPLRFIDTTTSRRIDYRKNFAVFSASSGNLVEEWPVIAEDEVNVITLSPEAGSGKVYIGSDGRVGLQRYELEIGDYYEYKKSLCNYAAALSADVELNCFNRSSPVKAIVAMDGGAAVAEESGSIFGVDGDSVSAMATDGNGVVVAGDFNVAGGGERLRLAAFDDEGFLKGWNPGADAAVSALTVDSSIIYAGGSFTLSGDGIASTERNHLAAYDAAGNLLSWNPGVDKAVSALTVNHGVVYAGGGFSNVSDNSGTFARHCLAAFDSSGNLLPWSPEGNGWVYALAASDDRIYVGNQSTTSITSCGTGSGAYSNLAAFDLGGNLAGWSAETNGEVRAIAIDGSTVYAMGAFSEAGGGTGSATRNRLAAFDTNGNLTAWNPGLSGGYPKRPSSLLVSDGLIYAAGDFSGVGDGSGDSVASGLVAIMPSGQLASWMPELDGSPSSMVIDGNGIYVGGAFALAAEGEAVSRRSGLVVFDTNGNVLDR